MLFREAEPCYDGKVFLHHPISISVSKRESKRALHIFNNIFQTFEALGCQVSQYVDNYWHNNAYDRVGIKIYGEYVCFSIEELSQAIPYSEQTGYKKSKPSTRFKLRIENRLPNNIRVTWNDAKVQRIENCLTDICNMILEAGEYLEAEAEKKRIKEARIQTLKDEYQAEVDVYNEQLNKIAEEKKRVRGLLDESGNWKQAQQLREYIEAIKETELSHHGSIRDEKAEWIEWSQLHADRLDPLTASPHSFIDDVPPKPVEPEELAEKRRTWY